MIDQQIIEKPRCANPNCERDALVYMGNSFYCGLCVVKLKRKNDLLIQSMMEDL